MKPHDMTAELRRRFAQELAEGWFLAARGPDILLVRHAPGDQAPDVRVIGTRPSLAAQGELL